MDPRPKPSVWWEHADKAIAYLVIMSWDVSHSLKAKLALYVIPAFLSIFAVLELLGAVLHLSPWIPWIPYGQGQVFQAKVDDVINFIPEWIRRILAVLLFSAVLFMVWHHRRIRHDIRRHRAVIAMARSLNDEMLNSGNQAQGDPKQYIRNVLRALVYTLERWTHRTGWLNATLVVSESGSPFYIFDQWPDETFPDGIALDPRHSAAAQAALEKDTMVFIPYTRFIHGMRLAVGDGRKDGPDAKTDFVDNAFQAVQGVKDYPIHKLRALVCVEVPNVITRDGRLTDRTGLGPDSSIVLCLGCERSGKLGHLDFVTIQLAAKLLAAALKEKY